MYQNEYTSIMIKRKVERGIKYQNEYISLIIKKMGGVKISK